MPRKISIKQFLMKTGKFNKVFDCVSAIRKNRITINNKKITNPSYFFNPKTALVKLDNEKIKSVNKLYFILNKPSGCLSQKSENEKTIYNILDNLKLSSEQKKSLFAVGRLDKDTEGLMIITNDGELSSIISSPKNQIIKRYYAMLEIPINKEKIKELEKGIELDIDYKKYKTKPCKIKTVAEKEIYISISEGKKRQIRKMFEAIGNKVVYLRRVSIGGLQLGNLKAGELLQMKKDEIYKNLNLE